MERSVQDQLARQKQYQQQATQAYTKNLGQQGATPAKQAIGTGTQDALARYQQIQKIPLSLGAPATPGTVSQQDPSVLAAQRSMSNQQNAGLQGYNSWLQGLGLGNQDTANQLGITSNLSQGWANLLPYQLQDASQSQAGLDALGGLLSSAGGALGMYGATRPAAGLGGLGSGGYFDMPMSSSPWNPQLAFMG